MFTFDIKICIILYIEIHIYYGIIFESYHRGGNTMEIGQQIKKYRDQLHLSQEQLADKIYVTRQTISNWEKRHKYAGHKYFD